MIFAMNALKMVFAWIVSVVFLVIKKLGAQAKLKQKKDYNIQKKLSLPCDVSIYVPEEDLEMK